MRKFSTVFLIFFFLSEVISQNIEDREYIKSQTNIERLNQISIDYWKIQNRYIAKTAQKNLTNKNGQEMFSHFDNYGNPIYYTLENESSGRSSKIDVIRTGGSSGLDLDGNDIIFGLWDGGNPRATHRELSGKIEIFDIGTVTSHASHVAGILVATGVEPEARGMAPSATITSFTTTNWISEIPLWASEGGMISNHSYIVQNPKEEYEKFGIYNEISQVWDDFSYNAPYLMMCTGASNNGNNDYNPDNSRFDLLASNKLGKNAIVVGTCSDVLNYTGPESVQQASFTSWGPTDDWRIKPDITAVGTNSFSTGETNDNNYRTGQGSSFAAPIVAGGLGLLQQHYHNLNSVYMKSVTAKALILSTTDEAGLFDGPDFSNGWGLFNAKKAADVISNNGRFSMIEELTLNQDETYSFKIKSDGTEPLSVAVCWNDPSSEPLTAQAFNDRTVMLINDLDVRVTSDSVEYYPWKMEPNAEYDNFTAPAVKGDNFRDNIEIINVENIEAGEYTVTVSHKGILQSGVQEFSIVVNGIEAEITSTTDIKTLDQHLSIYPNPVDNILNIDFDMNTLKELKVGIYNISGQKIDESHFYDHSPIKLDVSHLSKAPYFIKVQDKNSDFISIQKIIIQ